MTSSKGASTLSLSRTFARWALELRYQDLPPQVVDKLKALICLAGHGALLGHGSDEVDALAALVTAEESRSDGATLLATGDRVTRQAAALGNVRLMEVRGLFDSYRMITHPGPALLAAALANAEMENRSGADLLRALAAGYEFTCRLANDHVPSVSARGFRPAPVFSVMGAALTSALLLGLDEDEVVAAIALAANTASGLNESARAVGGELAFHDANAARQGVSAAVLARVLPRPATELVVEGEAGFLHAYAGSSKGRLTHTFEGSLQRSLTSITVDLGSDWELLHVMFRMFDTAGYNQPVIEVMRELREVHGFTAADIAEITVRMNRLETTYPSPEFPRFADWQTPRVDSTHFYAAAVAVAGDYPQVGEIDGGFDQRPLSTDARVLDLMTRVRLEPADDYPMFSPAVTIRLHDGETVSGSYSYSRMEWGLSQTLARLTRSQHLIAPGRAETLIHAVKALDAEASVTPLVAALSG